MTQNLLLVTNDAKLSNVMKQGIEQAGYHLYTAKRKGEAVILTDEENCSLAFLDLDIGERVVTDIGQAIRISCEKLIAFDKRFHPFDSSPGVGMKACIY